MAKDTAMQFYLNKKVEESCLIEAFNRLLGMRVESLEQPDEEATAFLMTTDYEIGFPMGLNLSWMPDLTPKNDYLDVARWLAVHYQTFVATDLPENDPDASNPFYWNVAKPDGTLVKMTQDTQEWDGEEGLILTDDFYIAVNGVNGHFSQFNQKWPDEWQALNVGQQLQLQAA